MHARPSKYEEPFDYTAPRDSWPYRLSSHPRRQPKSSPHRPRLLHAEDVTRFHGPHCRVHHAARLPRIAHSDRVLPEALGSALRGPGKPRRLSSHPCLANYNSPRDTQTCSLQRILRVPSHISEGHSLVSRLRTVIPRS